ncbi:hypothetical protein Asppvi_009591 [Aspergillus pseudoviridinutans]|uniref:Hydrophobin n=1 Tax=Aspergillus pseudoviridinutans TaxID=1517512 RepID=A0A9P3BJU1_9EURO|nr:uncharacterized protein Asppvi_009591 [Aspergillus pseudoviridinutans]GIJ90630.1 hypothetical protein Asppvi_009591 [Aspergillus pseudoviridinutans]
MRLLSLALFLSAAVALPSAEKSCSGVGFPCGNATVNAYDCCVPLVCGPGAKPNVIVEESAERGMLFFSANRY